VDERLVIVDIFSVQYSRFVAVALRARKKHVWLPVKRKSTTSGLAWQ
jgi:hypothetical protein